jgi:hypothetical protein
MPAEGSSCGGRVARAANAVIEHGVWNGIPFPFHRLETPRRKDGSSAAGPVLMDLVIHDWPVCYWNHLESLGILRDRFTGDMHGESDMPALSCPVPVNSY